MKGRKITIKKRIEKKIEFRHKQLGFINEKPKKNTADKQMDELDRLRIFGDGKKPVDVTLLTRSNIRLGNKNDDDKILPILEKKYPISIIITAYQTENFIEECLNSIENQTYFINNNDYEILIGIDSCSETLRKLSEIRYKYRNVRIFMMDSNMGTYVTSNTLLDLVKNDNIIRFDSDDVMKLEMINEIMYYIDEYDVIQFHFSDFTTDITKCNNNFKYVAAGAHFYKKSVIELAGGYCDWKCAADSEFIKRISKFVRLKIINKRLFYRRGHVNSITNRIETDINSELRSNYLKQIKSYDSKKEIKIKKRINTYVEI